MSFSYQLYGLRCQSEIELLNLPLRDNDQYDLKFSIGSLPAKLEQATEVGLGLQVNADTILLTINGIARYGMMNGKEIIIDPVEGIDTASLVNFLLSSALPYLLTQRKQIILRGVAYTLDGKSAQLILGLSGTGKSSILAGLCQRGAKFVADQFVMLTAHPNKIFLVNAGFPVIKLWKDTTKQLALPKPQLSKVRPNIERYYWAASEYFCDHSLPLRNIIRLETKNVRPEESQLSLAGIKKFEKILQLQFAHHLQPYLKRDKQQIRNLAMLANAYKIRSYTRINGQSKIHECLDDILKLGITTANVEEA